jgi:superfamily II DNA/RNA helicase
VKNEAVKAEKQVLIVCPSAERAIVIIPQLKSVAKIGKLFARHIKINDQIDALKKSTFPISVGTPNRILKLIEAGWCEWSVEVFYCGVC